VGGKRGRAGGAGGGATSSGAGGSKVAWSELDDASRTRLK
jgi:hypothetical protein